MGMPMSSPLRPRFDTVIRTQSGSLIDHLSKQPTPAPTERSDHNEDDMFDELDPASASTSFFTNHLATPEATPAKTLPNTQMNKVCFFSLAHALLSTTHPTLAFFS